MDWLIAEYKATTLFSLKMLNATSSAAKSLVCPSPYAIKMALLDAIIRTKGLAEGQSRFKALRDMAIAVGVPRQIVVNNCFIKVLDPVRPKGKKGEPADTADDDPADDDGAAGLSSGPLKSNITFREYVYLDGSLRLAFAVDNDVSWILEGLVQINSFGKRGCFFQLQASPRIVGAIPSDYVLLTAPGGNPPSFPLDGLAQVVDDMAPQATFANVNTYSEERGARQNRVIVLPYRRRVSSKSYTCYERLAGWGDEP